MTTRVLNFLHRHGAELVIGAFLLLAAIVYAPYHGDLAAVGRPKGAVATLAVVALGVLALLHARSRDRAPRDVAVASAIVTLLAFWLASTAAAWPGWSWTWDLLRPELVLGLGVAAASLLPQSRRALLRVLPWAGLLVAVTVLVQAHGVAPPGLPSNWIVIPGVKLPAGTFVHRNNPAFLMAVCLAPMALAAVQARGTATRVLWSCATAALVAAILATRCRGAWAAALLGILVLLVFHRKWRAPAASALAVRLVTATAPASVLVALVLTLPSGALPVKPPRGVSHKALATQVHINRQIDERSLASRVDVLSNHRTLTDRLDYWKHAAGLIADAPLFGGGPGAFRASAATHLGSRYFTPKRAHNTFIETATDAGVPAALALIALFLIGLARAWRNRDAGPEATIMAAMLVVLGVYLSLEPINSVAGAHIGIVLGAAVGMRHAAATRAESTQRGVAELALQAAHDPVRAPA